VPIFLDSLKAAGYTIALDKSQFDFAVKNSKKVYLTDTASLDNSASMYYMIDSLSRVSLADFTKKAIEFLDNPNGFFIMVEGGKIDWASHANDMATIAYETLDFDRAIRVALDFYRKHPDQTVIIVTADHETGGLALGNNTTGYDTYLEKLSAQWRSKDYLVRALEKADKSQYQQVLSQFVHYDFDVNQTEQPGDLVNQVIDQLQQQAGIGWTSHKHTGTLIPTYVIGPAASQYNGIIDNTYTFEVLLKVTGLKK
jgi:alkaline phosphatase